MKSRISPAAMVTSAAEKKGSVVCLYTPVSPSVPGMEGINATGGTSFIKDNYTLGGVYVPCIDTHARWSGRGPSVVVSLVC